MALVGVFVLQGLSFVAFGLSRPLLAIYLSGGLFAVTAWSIPALMAALAATFSVRALPPRPWVW